MPIYETSIDEPAIPNWPVPREIELTRNTIAECLQAISHAAMAAGQARDPVCVERWIAEMVRLRLATGVAVERLYARIESLEELVRCCR